MTIIESLTIPLVFKIRSWFENNNLIKQNPKKNIYLLGQGWFAKGFVEYIDKSHYMITNIYRFPFINTPMLLGTVKSGFDSGSKKVGKFTKLIDNEIQDEVISIDLELKKIITLEGKTHSWLGGYLVCGLGSNTDIGKFWTEKIKHLKDLKLNSNLCIVGAGPTGTELAFHLTDLGYKSTLYDGLPQVYGFLTPKGKDYIIKKLESKSIGLHTSKMFSDEDKKKFDHVIFAIGSRSNDLTSKWKITNQLTLESYPDVFGGGDCIGGLNLPKTAQVAYQQGMYVAQKLNSLAKNQIIDDFKFISKGTIIYTGKGWYYVELNIFGSKYSLIMPEIVIGIYYKWLK